MHTWREISSTALTEAVGGAVAGAIADTVLYGVDTAKIRHQQAQTGGNVASLYRGLAPSILLGSVPVFGTFFLLYAPVRDVIMERYQRPEWLPVASAVCAVPATLISVPADVLKKRLVLATEPVTAPQAIKELIKARGFFAGWHINLIRDLPFAAVKVSLYEVMVQYYLAYVQAPTVSDDSNNDGGKPKISPLGASLCGVASGVVCGVVTCPLDVVNTSIKAHANEGRPRPSLWTEGYRIVQQNGTTALFRGAGLRAVILGLGSSIFWPIQQGVAQSWGADTLQPLQEMLLEVYQVGR